ncbi:MAG: hypothetical protein RLZZ292_1325 [Bacteroidota bacterium]|jgi:hypothetical protein
MKYFLLFNLFFVFIACRQATNGNNNASNDSLTSLKIDNDTYDFGTIQEGERVEHIFKFTNTGTQPLLIKDAQVTCGCTTPSWSKDPIMPNQTGELKALFSSAGKGSDHPIRKTINVVCNTEQGQHLLILTGTVKPTITEGAAGWSILKH